jgi:hypothetical protein
MVRERKHASRASTERVHKRLVTFFRTMSPARPEGPFSRGMLSTETGQPSLLPSPSAVVAGPNYTSRQRDLKEAIVSKTIVNPMRTPQSVARASTLSGSRPKALRIRSAAKVVGER